MTYQNNHYTQIPGFSDYYISKSTSEVLSTRKFSPYIMKQSVNSTTSNSTYFMVRMVNDDGFTEKQYIHRLMATVFIENIDPVNKIEVNHINGNKQDNRIENLEWVSKRENSIHAYSTGLNKTVQVEQYNLDGNFIASYNSIKHAEEVTKVHNPNITKVLKGKRKTAGGYIWKYPN